MADDTPPEFAWTDFFELAQELGQRENEAAQRSAISRSYYAVFHLALIVLDHHDPEFAAIRSQDSHKQVWDRVNALPNRQAKSAVRSGRNLLHARKAADYQLLAGDWRRRTESALHEAERALNLLEELLR